MWDEKDFKALDPDVKNPASTNPSLLLHSVIHQSRGWMKLCINITFTPRSKSQKNYYNNIVLPELCLLRMNIHPVSWERVTRGSSLGKERKPMPVPQQLRGALTPVHIWAPLEPAALWPKRSAGQQTGCTGGFQQLGWNWMSDTFTNTFMYMLMNHWLKRVCRETKSKQI